MRAGRGETSLLVLSPCTEFGARLQADFAQWMSVGWQVIAFRRLLPPLPSSPPLACLLLSSPPHPSSPLQPLLTAPYPSSPRLTPHYPTLSQVDECLALPEANGDDDEQEVIALQLALFHPKVR